MCRGLSCQEYSTEGITFPSTRAKKAACGSVEDHTPIPTPQLSHEPQTASLGAVAAVSQAWEKLPEAENGLPRRCLSRWTMRPRTRGACCRARRARLTRRTPCRPIRLMGPVIPHATRREEAIARFADEGAVALDGTRRNDRLRRISRRVHEWKTMAGGCSHYEQVPYCAQARATTAFGNSCAVRKAMRTGWRLRRNQILNKEGMH